MHSDEDKEIFFIKDKFFPKICLHHLKFLNFLPKSLTTQDRRRTQTIKFRIAKVKEYLK